MDGFEVLASFSSRREPRKSSNPWPRRVIEGQKSARPLSKPTSPPGWHTRMKLCLNSSVYRVAAWCGVAILLGAVIATAIFTRWQGVAALSGFLAGSVVFLLMRERLPSLIDLLFVLAALINAAGWVFDLWERVPWTDPLTHFYTPFAVTLALGLVVYRSASLHFREHNLLFIVTIASFGLALGGLWEVFEWTIGVPETRSAVILDLTMDALGALVAGVVGTLAIHDRAGD